MAAAPLPAGSSGRSLAEKLGFREGMAVAFVSLPPELEALADSAGFGQVVRPTGGPPHWGRIDRWTPCMRSRRAAPRSSATCPGCRMPSGAMA